MSLFVLPPPNEPHSAQVTTLDGVQYELRFDWVQRWGRWTMGVSTTNGVSLVEGAPLVCGADLLAPYRSDPRVPQGALIVVDQSGAKADPGWASFARQHALLYVGYVDPSSDVVLTTSPDSDMDSPF